VALGHSVRQPYGKILWCGGGRVDDAAAAAAQRCEWRLVVA
jgi:hypothetical protein